MGIYEEEKKGEQASLTRKGLIIGILIVLAAMFWDYFRGSVFNPFLFFTYGILLIGSFVLLSLLRIKKYVVPIVYVAIFLYAIGILLLHQQTGLMEDYGDLGIPILISAVTFILGWGGGIFVTIFSGLFYILLVYLEYFQIIPPHSISGIPLHQRLKGFDVINLAVGKIMMWYALCVMTGFLYRLMDSKRRELARSKEELVSWSEELSKRVEERTRELKEVQEKLFLSEKMSGLGQLSIGIAHEINNPLSIIVLNAELLSRNLDSLKVEPISGNGAGPFLKGECQVFLRRITDASKRCRDIIENLLSFSQGLRQAKLRLSRVDSNTMIDDTISLLSEEIRTKNISVVKNYAGFPLMLMCDVSKIKQALFNVLLNAVQSMSKNGRLAITTILENENVKIEIVDTGCGISKENLKKVFDPFFSTKDKGIGMGFPISYMVVESHNGSIDIESEIGKGTKVTINLPK